MGWAWVDGADARQTVFPGTALAVFVFSTYEPGILDAWLLEFHPVLPPAMGVCASSIRKLIPQPLAPRGF